MCDNAKSRFKKYAGNVASPVSHPTFNIVLALFTFLYNY